MKKFLAIVLCMAMVFSFAGCGDTTKEESKESSDVKTSWTIGVCQLVQHDALDAATNGFIAAVEEGLGKDNVTILNQNASGEVPNCATIINGFVSQNVDLILANATPALQAAASGTADIPILGTAVTHYAPALEISDWTGTVGGNISGTSDLADLSKQADMITEWFPETKKVGILFCSSEANSIYQAQEIETCLADKGIETKEFTFTDSNDVASVAQAACNFADVIYIPTDNVAAANTEAIANVVLPAKKPVIAGESGLCKGCGVATLSIDYYDLGLATGKMAVEILKNGKDISTMPIEYAPNTVQYFNQSVCEQLGITPLDGYTAIE